MIRHIVFFTLKSGNDAETAIRHLERLATIPGSIRFEVRRNLKVDQIGNEVDLVVYGEFPSLAALQAYKEHPTYADVTVTVRPMRELRFAADVED